MVSVGQLILYYNIVVLETILPLDNLEVCTSINRSVTVISEYHNKTYYYMLLKHLLRYSVKILNKSNTIVTKVLPNTFVFSVLFLSHTLCAYTDSNLQLLFFIYYHLLGSSTRLSNIPFNYQQSWSRNAYVENFYSKKLSKKRGLIEFLIKEQINEELKQVELISFLG